MIISAIQSLIRFLAAQTSSKSILVLGAGYVSAPVVDYLSSKGLFAKFYSQIFSKK